MMGNENKDKDDSYDAKKYFPTNEEIGDANYPTFQQERIAMGPGKIVQS